MTDPAACKIEASALVSEVGEVLDAYLRIDDQLFSWKNTFGWNNVEPLKPQIPLLLERMGLLIEKVKAQQAQIAELSDDDLDKPVLAEFYKLFDSYTDTLKLAIQGMNRVLGHIETKRLKKADFKKVRYESDLMIYKTQVDKYQLYGEKLNKLIQRLQ